MAFDIVCCNSKAIFSYSKEGLLCPIFALTREKIFSLVRKKVFPRYVTIVTIVTTYFTLVYFFLFIM